VLAEKLGVSIRTLYRDIASLQHQGAAIQGEPGVGYVLAPGYLLPPLMFHLEEIEALVLGMRWVAERGDAGLSEGARGAIAKVAAVLPTSMRRDLEDSALLVGTSVARMQDVADTSQLRQAIRAEAKVRLTYRDSGGGLSNRVIWPFALVHFEQTRVLSAWCELRADFRNFRTDRIAEVELLDTRYPQRRQSLLATWRHSIQASGRSILPEGDGLPS
jgi:predicted DNA-binding transcriptional regulator YafY